MKKVTAQQCCVQRSAATSNLFCFVLNGDFRLQKTQFYYVLFTVLDLNSFADIVGIVLFQCYCTLRLIRTVRWYQYDIPPTPTTFSSSCWGINYYMTTVVVEEEEENEEEEEYYYYY